METFYWKVKNYPTVTQLSKKLFGIFIGTLHLLKNPYAYLYKHTYKYVDFRT